MLLKISAPGAIREAAAAGTRNQAPADGQKWQLQGLSFFTGRNYQGKQLQGSKAAQRPLQRRSGTGTRCS